MTTLHLASGPQLANAWTIVRLSLHVLAASVWVGGQLVLAGLVVTLRGISHDAPGKVARAFARLSWPAFWLFGVKMFCVIVAGLGAFMHTKATSPTAKGVYAGVGTIATIAALVLGVALSG